MLQSSERYARVSELFQAAAELPPQDRMAFLGKQCDESLRLEVEALLKADAQAFAFIEQPIAELPADLFAECDEEDFAGRSFGSYRVIREIGRGGLGAVYLAARADEQFQKQVAIKVVKRGLDTDDILRRFRAERQILAQLEHPNIARLIDAGSTDDGLPYFVMEYVEGESITSYCDAHQLSTTERLELFRLVCGALTYAHQHLVIHRDIKPSNILVTGDGIPKLLDFGIAKVLHAEDPLAALTMTGVRVMTPEYASPEQVRGLPVSTATDVYSLGVLLYELLTGAKPYRLTSHGSEELSRAITDQIPERPSTTASRNQRSEISLPKSLRGDLDNIVLMALRKEPERRYSSVEHFSEDIRRHCQRLPVRARQPTFSYRAQKFVQRNKIGVAAALIVFLTLVSGIIVTVIQTERVVTERNRARQEAAKATRISTFLQDVLAFSSPDWLSSNPRHNREATIADALETASRRVETELTDQPEVAAAVHFTLGMTYKALFRLEPAEKHMRESLAIRRRLLDPQDQDFAQSLAGLGDVLWAGGKAEAEAPLREAVAIYRRAEKNGEVDAKWFTIALNDLGLAVQYAKKGDPTEAEALYHEALAVAARLTGADRAPIAIIYSNLGTLRSDHGDLDGAMKDARRAIEEQRLVPGGEFRMETGVFLSNLGNLLGRRGDLAAGREVLQEAIEFFLKTLGDSHARSAAPIALLADNYCRAGDYGRALEEARRALEILKRAYSDEEHADFVRAWIPLGKALTHTGEIAEGERVLRRALMVGEKKLPPKHQRIANTQSALGENLALQERYQEANELLQTSYDNMKSTLGVGNPDTLAAAERLQKFQQVRAE